MKRNVVDAKVKQMKRKMKRYAIKEVCYPREDDNTTRTATAGLLLNGGGLNCRVIFVAE